MSSQQIPVTSGQKVILETIKSELFPQIEKLKDVLMKIQACRISFQIYSKELQGIENDYYIASKGFFEIVKKLETPDILFKNVAGGKLILFTISSIRRLLNKILLKESGT